MMDPEPKKAPAISLPKSNATCTVSIVNTTTDITVPPAVLVEPDIPGKKWLNLPTYSFYVKHSSGAEIIFDLGSRADWQNSVPHIADLCANHVPGLKVTKDVPDILKEGGVKINNLKALILSHWHFDHCGNLASLPPSIDLIVGPGFKDAFLPGYPAKEDSPFWEADFKGRNVIEAPFNTRIGKFGAWDYFGDGSCYILDVPGHAIGHVSALVRTTPDTAVFLGGDVCHFTGDIRPTEYLPLPDPIPAQARLDKRLPHPCPCSVFTACHPVQDAPRTTPFYKCSTDPNTFYVDPPTAMRSINYLTEFDANPNILVIVAHDTAPKEIMTQNFFPQGDINDWKAKGWKEKMHWHFLNELPVDGKEWREPMVDGLYQDGKRIKTLGGESL